MTLQFVPALSLGQLANDHPAQVKYLSELSHTAC
jgi:hypothetical protein